MIDALLGWNRKDPERTVLLPRGVTPEIVQLLFRYLIFLTKNAAAVVATDPPVVPDFLRDLSSEEYYRLIEVGTYLQIASLVESVKLCLWSSPTVRVVSMLAQAPSWYHVEASGR